MQNQDTTPDWIYNNIKDAAGQAEKLYFIYLGSILFVLISLSTIPDKALYLQNSTLKLPLIHSEVPVEIFVWFAPLLLVFIYIGLQVALHKVAELSSKVKNIDHNKKEDRVFPFSLYNSLVYPEGGIFGTIQTLFAGLSTFYSIVFVCLKAFCVTLKGREIFKESAVFAITCFAFILATYYQRRFREASNSQNKVKYTSKINAFIWGLIAFCPSFIWLLNEDEYIINDWFLYSSLFVLACITGLIGYLIYKCFRKRKLITRKCFYCSKFSFLFFFIAIGLWTLSFWLLTDKNLLYQDWYPTNLLIENIEAKDKFKYGRTINWKGATLINISMPYFGQKFGGQIILDHAIIYDQLWGDFTRASLKYADISETDITNLKIDNSTDLTYAKLKNTYTQAKEKKDDEIGFSMNYRANSIYWLGEIVNGINLSEAELEGENNKFKGTIFVNSDLRNLSIKPTPDDFCQAYSLWNTEIDQKKLGEIKKNCLKVLQPMNLNFFIDQLCKNKKDEKNKQHDKLCAEKKYSQYSEDTYGINQDDVDEKQIELIKNQIKEGNNYFRGAYFGELNLEGIVFKNSDLTFTDFSKAQNITCEKIGFLYELDQIFTSLFDKKPKPANLCETLSLYGSKSNCSNICPEKYKFPSCELALKVSNDFVLVKDLIEERNLSGLPLNATKEKPKYDKCSIADYDNYFSSIKENICLAKSLKNTQLSDDLKIFVTKYCPDKLK